MSNMENASLTLANGTQIDPISHKMLSGPAIPPFTDREKARAARAKQLQSYRNAARRGVMKAVENAPTPDQAARIAAKGGISLPLAIECVTETLTETITLNPDANEGARVRAWESVQKSAGLVEDDRAEQATTQGVTVNVIMSGDAQDRALDIVREFTLLSAQR
jgi:hypothetical protein